MELSEVMRTTFACREYTDEAVSDRQVHDILELARFAPSGGNRQGNRVVVVRDPATKNRLSELAKPAAQRYGAQVAAGENPWNTVVPTAVSDETVAATEPPEQLVRTFRSAPVLLVFLVDLRVVASMDQYLPRVGVISGASIYPFVWNTLLAAREAGLGGTITTLTSAEEPRVQGAAGGPAALRGRRRGAAWPTGAPAHTPAAPPGGRDRDHRTV